MEFTRKVFESVIIRPINSEDVDILTINCSFPWTTLEESKAKWQKYYEGQQKTFVL